VCRRTEAGVGWGGGGGAGTGTARKCRRHAPAAGRMPAPCAQLPAAWLTAPRPAPPCARCCPHAGGAHRDHDQLWRHLLRQAAAGRGGGACAPVCQLRAPRHLRGRAYRWAAYGHKAPRLTPVPRGPSPSRSALSTCGSSSSTVTAPWTCSTTTTTTGGVAPACDARACAGGRSAAACMPSPPQSFVLCTTTPHPPPAPACTPPPQGLPAAARPRRPLWP
jgi:hypothetical protein